MLVSEVEALVDVNQAVVRHERGNVRQLGLLGPQKLPPCGDVVEEILDRDRCAGRQGALFDLEQLAAADLDACADWLAIDAGL